MNVRLLIESNIRIADHSNETRTTALISNHATNFILTVGQVLQILCNDQWKVTHTDQAGKFISRINGFRIRAMSGNIS